MADDLELHPLLRQVDFLLGRWEGTSLGLWVPGERLEFRDVIEFRHVGKPHLSYDQQTWRAGGVPSHGERGYLIAIGPGTVDWTLAQPAGVVEILTGEVADQRVTLRSGSIVLTPSAKPVTDVHRVYEVAGDTLTYELQIAMNGEPLAPHIAGTLSRVS
jgi:hypothetical protein